MAVEGEEKVGNYPIGKYLQSNTAKKNSPARARRLTLPMYCRDHVIYFSRKEKIVPIQEHKRQKQLCQIKLRQY